MDTSEYEIVDETAQNAEMVQVRFLQVCPKLCAKFWSGVHKILQCLNL